MVKDLTTGKPLRLILGFSVPIILGNLIQQAYSWADTMMVGKILGNGALSSVGSTGAITFLIIGFLIGIAEGSCLLVSRYFGAGNKAEMRRCVGNIIYVCLGITLLLTVFALLFNRQILTLMNTPTDIIDGAAEYLSVIYIGMAASMLYNVSAGVMRALGDSRSPLYFLIMSAIMNIGLNYLFMVIIPLGIKGAALATVISQFFSGLASLVYIKLKIEDLRLSSNDLKPRRSFIGKICALSLPMAFQYSITAIGSIFLQTSINGLGSNAVTAFTVGDKVWNFGWACINCVGVALAGYCSQNIGAAKLYRVRQGVRYITFFCLGMATATTVIFLLFGSQLSSLFLSEKTDEIINNLHTYYLIHSPFMPILSMIGVYRNAIMGMGYSLQGMLAGFLELIGRTVISVSLVNVIGFMACCFASPAAWLMADLLLIPMYFHIVGKLGKEHPEWLTEETQSHSL